MTASKPLNILHLTFDMGIGGTEQVIKNLIEGSTDMPLNHHICCLEGPVGPWGEELEQAGIPVFKLQRQAKITFDVILKIRKIIRENNIDIVHGHQYTPFVFGFFASRLTNAKIIFTEHGRLYPDIVSTKRRFINKLIFPFVDGVTSISKATKQALIENEGIPANSIDVIYNGIKPVPPTSAERLNKLRAELDIPKDATVFGTVARLDPIKNQRLMIEGFAKAYLENNNIRLVIVGDGPEWDSLNSLVKELSLKDVVKFTGYKPNPKDYINLFDVFLLTSKTEGTSMTLLEAMSAGKPSIVTNVGGNPEIISHPALGNIIGSESSELHKTITNTLAKCFTQDQTDEIKNWYLSNYSISCFTNAFLNVYRNTMKFEGLRHDSLAQ